MVDGGAGATEPTRPTAASWRALIVEAADVLWPSLTDGPLWIEAQVNAESGGDPRAVSPSGAMGLLQLMPGTAAEMRVTNPFDPAENVRGGVAYLRRQFELLGRVPDQFDRLLWAFASYNCGRGYVNKALGLAEMDKALPGGDRWWSWPLSWRYLAHRHAAITTGRWADYHQVVRYVGGIQTHAARLGAKGRW